MRALHIKDLSSIDRSGYGELLLMRGGVRDADFSVHALMLKLTMAVTNGAVSDVPLDPAFFGQAATIKLTWSHLNQPVLNQLPLAALDLWEQRIHRGIQVVAYDAMAAQVVTASSTATKTFYLRVPFYFPRTWRPGDFIPRLNLLKNLSVNIPAGSLDANGDLSIAAGGISLECKAIGYYNRASTYDIPSAFCVEVLTGKSGNNVDLTPTGQRIRSVDEYTIDDSVSPIAGEVGPRVQFDGRQVADFTNWTAAEMTALMYDPGLGAGPLSMAQLAAQALVAPLVYQATGARISDSQPVDTVAVQYASRLTTPSDARWIIDTLYETGPVEQSAAVKDNCGCVTDLAKRISIPGVVNGFVLDSTLVDFLPRKVAPPIF